MGARETVTLWGVRGSVPTPGESTVRHGGNTSCVSIEWGQERCLVLDAGTGIRALGKRLLSTAAEIYVLITHRHWDHIQGFPFFDPIYQIDRPVHMFPSPVGKETLCALIDQMDGAHFPVHSQDLMGRNECIMEDPLPYLEHRGIHVTALPLNHPGGAHGYRVMTNGHSIVYMPDNELDPPGPPVTSWDEFIAFCRGADILIHDAQYLPDDMPERHGWGHSVVDQTLRLGAAAGVKHLVLFHHDPERTDDQLDVIQRQALEWAASTGDGMRCTVAKEGSRIDL